jgi:5-methylcytosine-specific restriction endonuclease McrA
MSRFSNKICHYCLIEPSTTVDHVVPRSKGGTSENYNKVGACVRCNNKKADRMPDPDHCPKCKRALETWEAEQRMAELSRCD